MKVPVSSSFEGDTVASSPCSTKLGGKAAKVYIVSHMYLDAGKNGKASKKGADSILILESPLFEISKSFAAGTYTSNLSLQSLSLWHSTPTYENEVNSQKIGESFSVDITFDDQGK